MSARDPSLSFVCEMIALYGPAAFRAEAARLYLVPAGGEEIEVRGADLEVLSLLAYWYKSTCLLVQEYLLTGTNVLEELRESWSDTCGHSRGALANQQGRGAPQAQHAVHAGLLAYWYKGSLLALLVQKHSRPSRPTRSRYSVYLLYWYKSTNTDAASRPTRTLERHTNTSWKRRGAVDKCGRRNVRKRLRYSVYLLYWYKSTNTDAAQMQKGRGHTLGGWGAKKCVERPQIQKGTQVPCFTDTKVQILTLYMYICRLKQRLRGVSTCDGGAGVDGRSAESRGKSGGH
jgi:hypothetical protein